jgi:hypothetical protein
MAKRFLRSMLEEVPHPWGLTQRGINVVSVTVLLEMMNVVPSAVRSNKTVENMTYRMAVLSNAMASGPPTMISYKGMCVLLAIRFLENDSPKSADVYDSIVLNQLP